MPQDQLLGLHHECHLLVLTINVTTGSHHESLQVILGCASAWAHRDDPSVWTAACLGPLMCLALCSQAGSRKWMENLGEVILMASVVYLESHPMRLVRQDS